MCKHTDGMQQRSGESYMDAWIHIVKGINDRHHDTPGTPLDVPSLQQMSQLVDADCCSYPDSKRIRLIASCLLSDWKNI